jgi:hypothetical protein
MLLGGKWLPLWRDWRDLRIRGLEAGLRKLLGEIHPAV